MQSWPTIATYFSRLSLSHRLHCSQRTGVRGGRDQNSAILGMTAQEIEHQAVALFAHSSPVHRTRNAIGNIRQRGANSFKAPVTRLCTSGPASSISSPKRPATLCHPILPWHTGPGTRRPQIPRDNYSRRKKCVRMRNINRNQGISALRRSCPRLPVRLADRSETRSPDPPGLRQTHQRCALRSVRHSDCRGPLNPRRPPRPLL